MSHSYGWRLVRRIYFERRTYAMVNEARPEAMIHGAAFWDASEEIMPRTPS